jgi:hypothetical protein
VIILKEPTWLWHKDCWEYRIPYHNSYFAGGQIRSCGGRFYYILFGSIRDKIEEERGSFKSFEEARDKVEKAWGNYNANH